MRGAKRTIRLALFFLPAMAIAVEPGEVRIQSARYAPPSAATVSVQTTLVDVGVTVRNRAGEPVGGFSVTDFELLDNGHLQKIVAFSEQRASGTAAKGAPPDKAPPRTIAFYFDDTNASAYALAQAKKAAAAMVGNDLPEDARAGVFTDSGSVTQDFTTNRQTLLDALSRVRPHPPLGPRVIGVCPSFSPYDAYAAAHRTDLEVEERLVSEAIRCNCSSGDKTCVEAQLSTVQTLGFAAWSQFRARSVTSLQALEIVVRHLATAPGTRILAMLSPGFVTGDLDQPKNSIVEAALRAHIVINALDPEGLEARGKNGPHVLTLSEFMAAVAHSTGGSFIRNTNGLQSELKKLTAIPEVSYLLAFAPTGKPDATMHKLKVRLKNGGSYHVDSRSTYFSAPPPEPKTTAQQRIDQAVLSKDPIEGVAARVQVVPAAEGSIGIDITVDAKVLRFIQREARSIQQLTFTTVLESASGEFLDGKQAVMDLDLSLATLTELEAKGIQATLNFRRPPGAWRIRQVIREAADNRIGAWTLAPEAQ